MLLHLLSSRTADAAGSLIAAAFVVFLSLWVNTYGVILFYEGVILFQFERELLGLTLSVRAAVFASLIASVQFAGGISKIGIVFGKYLSPLSYELHSFRIPNKLAMLFRSSLVSSCFRIQVNVIAITLSG